MYKELNKTISKNISKQYFVELQNSYFYALCASWFQSNHLFGIANFFKIQSDEEYKHSKRVLGFILERKIFIGTGYQFEDKLKSKEIKKIFIESYEREKQNSKNINELYKLADKVKDYHLQQFLDWFIKEQLEEETLFESILKKFDLLQTNTVYEIDKELLKRKKK